MYQSSWQAKPVVADGNPNEWSLPLRYSDSESGLQYNVTNDETNIYICIRATEMPIQMKIMSSGMEIWLDPCGKNKEACGIQFPLPGKRGKKTMHETEQPDMKSGKNPGRMNMAEQFQLEEPLLVLSGFLAEYNGTFRVSQVKGIKAAINWDEQNNMTYELAIPLQSFYSKEIKEQKDNPVIGFKININAIAGQGGGSNSGSMHSGPPGGASQGPGGDAGGGMEGGGGSGRGPGGRQGGQMGERPQSPDGQTSSTLGSSTSIKFKVKLNGLVQK
jgi:hypothetical protein